jgi:cyclase
MMRGSHSIKKVLDAIWSDAPHLWADPWFESYFVKDAAGNVLDPYRTLAAAPIGIDPVAWAREAVRRGAGEVLLCDIDRDGSGDGLNLDIGAQVTDAFDVPVILSGGCGRAEHLVEGFLEAGADAVAAGTYFCLRDQNPLQARAHVANAGVPIRMGT